MHYFSFTHPHLFILLDLRLYFLPSQSSWLCLSVICLLALLLYQRQSTTMATAECNKLIIMCLGGKLIGAGTMEGEGVRAEKETTQGTERKMVATS